MAKMESAAEAEAKQILVCFGENRRALTLLPSSNTSEREAVLELCRQEFRQQLPADLDSYALTLQMKSEDWGGIYVDYIDPDVVNKSIFQLIAVRHAVSIQFY